MPKWVRNSSCASRSGARRRPNARSRTLITAMVSSFAVVEVGRDARDGVTGARGMPPMLRRSPEPVKQTAPTLDRIARRLEDFATRRPRGGEEVARLTRSSRAEPRGARRTRRLLAPAIALAVLALAAARPARGASDEPTAVDPDRPSVSS